MKKKTIFILIDPKGSGKTFIGQLVQERFGIPFLRVEDIALEVRKERAIDNDDYIQEVFGVIEEAVRGRLQVSDGLIFESTGLTDAFDRMLVNLKREFSVALVQVSADPERCLKRVKARDAFIHVDVSDMQVNLINAAVSKKKFTFDGKVENNEAKTAGLIAQFGQIIEKFN